MKNYRLYGQIPWRVALVHGGPGALGSLSSLGKTLGAHFGVAELLQTRLTLPEILDEMKAAILEQCETPVILVGHSWGAMLSYIFAAQNPDLVSKIIMVASSVYTLEDSEHITSLRMERLSHAEQSAFKDFFQNKNPSREELKSFLALLSKADDYAPLRVKEDLVDLKNRKAQYDSVKADVKEMREKRVFFEMGTKIQCPVVALHGDHDPHPADSIQESLSQMVSDFKMTIFEKCGHTPWHEKFARDDFLKALMQEIG